MSDSDCSNCEKECLLRDDNYNCQVQALLDFRRNVGVDEMKNLNRILDELFYIVQNNKAIDRVCGGNWTNVYELTENLRQLHDPEIIKLLDVFEENA